MKKADHYRQLLGTLEDWESFLLQESGLPGPRANLELAQVVADIGDEALFRRLLANNPDQAPTNSPYEFLAFCGVVGLGRLLAEGQREMLDILRQCASDPRWRIREGIGLALQRLGKTNMDRLLQDMEPWSRGSLLEQRAAAVALCEPQQLHQEAHAASVLRMLDEITESLLSVEDRKSEQFRILRKAMGYCWSVATVALPSMGKSLMEKWLASDDKDVLWIMKENLRKKRLSRLDADWVEARLAQLGKS